MNSVLEDSIMESIESIQAGILESDWEYTPSNTTETGCTTSCQNACTTSCSGSCEGGCRGGCTNSCHGSYQGI